MSSKEDTTAHTGYSVIWREFAVDDGVQWNIGGPISTVERGQFNVLSFAESVVGESRVDSSSEGHEVAPKQDCDKENRYLA
jgi:hypothetical protein